jgi:hypothetical protein
MSVVHNYTNYKDDVDHDKNTRKYWFVVFGKGLYTKKCQASTARTASVSVKRAAPAAPYNAKPTSLEKKQSLYADTDNSDPELLKTNPSLEVPLAASLTVSCASSRATSALPGPTMSLAVLCTNSHAHSALSSLEEDEDVLMPAAPSVSPTVSSVSSLSATSAMLSAFSSISGALRAATPVRATMVAPSTPRPMVFNQKMRVLYDDL